jgi:hypothetical protein
MSSSAFQPDGYVVKLLQILSNTTGEQALKAAVAANLSEDQVSLCSRSQLNSVCKLLTQRGLKLGKGTAEARLVRLIESTDAPANSDFLSLTSSSGAMSSTSGVPVLATVGGGAGSSGSSSSSTLPCSVQGGGQPGVGGGLDFSGSGVSSSSGGSAEAGPSSSVSNGQGVSGEGSSSVTAGTVFLGSAPLLPSPPALQPRSFEEGELAKVISSAVTQAMANVAQSLEARLARLESGILSQNSAPPSSAPISNSGQTRSVTIAAPQLPSGYEALHPFLSHITTSVDKLTQIVSSQRPGVPGTLAPAAASAGTPNQRRKRARPGSGSLMDTIRFSAEEPGPSNWMDDERDSEEEDEEDDDVVVCDNPTSFGHSSVLPPLSGHPKGTRLLLRPAKRMRLRVTHRMAHKIYDDAVRQAATVSAYVARTNFKHIRNRKECDVLARFIDMAVEMAGEEVIDLFEPMELILRRLAAIVRAEGDDSWEVATFLEETPESYYLGPMDMHKEAQKFAKWQTSHQKARGGDKNTQGRNPQFKGKQKHFDPKQMEVKASA